jgi:hypothetical protein
MLALVLALQIAAQPTPAAPSAQPVPAQGQGSSPSPSPGPGKAGTPAAEEPPPKSLEDRLADLHVLWTQTCGNRAYGAYDDLCQNLGDEIRRAERQARKARLAPRRPPVPSAPPPTAAAGSVTAKAAPPPAH